jgi:hypothetical protein
MDTMYSEISGINQSTLKKILTHPQSYQKALEKGESKASHFVMGSLVDFLVLEDHEDFDDVYYVMEESDASDSIKDIIRHVYDASLLMDGTPSLDMLEKEIVAACETYNWNPRWGDEAKVKNIKKSGENYFMSLKMSKGRQIITQEQYNTALTVKASLLADKVISKFLVPNKDMTVFKKKVITFDYMGHECKGEMDLIAVDHKQKKIYPIDLKTIGTSVTSFQYDFWRFRYDFQAAFYTLGVQFDSEIGELFKEGYKLEYFSFIVAEINSNNLPLMYQVDKNVIEIGTSGGTLSSGKQLEGVIQAIRRYEFHTEKDNWDYPMEYFKGPLKIRV